MRWLLAALLALFATTAHAQLPQTQCVTTALAAGSGDAIAIPLLPCPETTALLVLTFSATNLTATPTISMNGQTPHVIVNFDGTALTAAFLGANQRRILTYNGVNWILLTGGAGGTSPCAFATSSSVGCVQPDNVTIGVNGSGVISVIDRPYDIDMFWPSVPPNAAIVRSAFTRNVSCPSGLAGSIGNARVAATATTVVSINHIIGGSSTPIGTATWSASGTVALFAMTGAQTFAAGDDVEFAFPNPGDSTLADIAITLKCSRL